jgi:hypothetical protein
MAAITQLFLYIPFLAVPSPAARPGSDIDAGRDRCCSPGVANLPCPDRKPAARCVKSYRAQFGGGPTATPRCR